MPRRCQRPQAGPGFLISCEGARSNHPRKLGLKPVAKAYLTPITLVTSVIHGTTNKERPCLNLIFSIDLSTLMDKPSTRRFGKSTNESARTPSASKPIILGLGHPYELSTTYKKREFFYTRNLLSGWVGQGPKPSAAGTISLYAVSELSATCLFCEKTNC